MVVPYHTIVYHRQTDHVLFVRAVGIASRIGRGKQEWDTMRNVAVGPLVRETATVHRRYSLHLPPTKDL